MHPTTTTAQTILLDHAELHIHEGNATRTVTLDNQPLTLGRAPENGIVLRSRVVSAQHARIEPDGPGHLLTDLGSTNGVQLGGVRLTRPHSLRDGDVLRIGDDTTGGLVTLTYHNPRVPPPTADAVASYPLNADDPDITIGRGACDLVLPSPMVSRLHATIERLADGRRRLRDHASANGTYVNGQRVSEHVLREGDIIQIGAFKLVYSISRLDRYDQQHMLRLAVRGLRRDVPAATGKRCVLYPVDLVVEPREFVAVIGGSGAGKSTLLRALSGDDPATGGTVLLNDDDLAIHYDRYQTQIGYVPQEDILHRALPVAHALDYTARLRLPDDTSPAELHERITQVLDEVELTSQRDRVIHTLSGGQRKRVSIAAELLASPGLLLLDEPASGLDPALEKKLMYTLRRIADSGRTVLMVTHATAHLNQCDLVVCMARGRVVFCGAPAEALSFFGISQGGGFADIYAKLFGWATPDGVVTRNDLSAEYAAWQAAHPDVSENPTLAELWELRFRQSHYYRQYVQERMPAPPAATPPSPAPPTTPPPRSRRASGWGQWRMLVQRYADLLRRDRAYALLLLVQAPLVGLLLLLVTVPDTLLGVQGVGLVQRLELRKVLFLMALASIWFGVLTAARRLVQEASVFRRERLIGLRLVPYVAANLVVLFAIALVQNLLFLGVLAVGLAVPPDHGVLLPLWAETGVTLVLATLAGSALGLLISATATSTDRAMAMVPAVLIVQILFAGQVFPISGWLSTAVANLTMSRWALDALGGTFNLNTYCDLPNVVIGDSTRPPLFCSQELLLRRPDTSLPGGFGNESGHLLTAWGWQGGLLVGCLLLTVLLLASRYRYQHSTLARLQGWQAWVPWAPPCPLPRLDDALPSALPTAPSLDDPTTVLLASSITPPLTDATIVLDDGNVTAAPAVREARRASGRPLAAIQRYQIEQELGRRGMFAVYRAYDPEMRRQVAIKVLRPEYVSPTFNRRFREEAEAIATLEYPSIVRVFDVGEINERPYLVMQFLAGGTLAARMEEQGTLTLAELVPILSRVAIGLDEAHSRNILHRNLKPVNILINTYGQAFVSDFGNHITAEVIGDLSSRDVFDANYLSPEQVRLIEQVLDGAAVAGDQQTAVTARSDIYALAAIAYHALGGVPPYTGDTPHATAMAHLHGTLQPIEARNPTLPPGTHTVLARALAREPAARYPSALAFVRALAALLPAGQLPPELDPVDLPPLAVAPLRVATAGDPTAGDPTAGAPMVANHGAGDRYNLPETVGRYRIEGLAGRGGMAMVYQAYDAATRRRVAIKVLSHQFTSTPAFLARFRQEAELIATLEHDSIVQIYDVGEHHDQPFIVMQYLAGGTLAARIRHQPLDLRRMLAVIERIAAGLDIAHQQQIIHLDIKPANILFDSYGGAHLSDFGIAIIAETVAGQTARRSVGGTPHYMSPEQAALLLGRTPPGAVSARSDVYALGIVLYQGLTGTLPFAGSTAADVAHAQLVEAPPTLRGQVRGVPPALDRVLACALAKDPADRYSTAGALARDLRALL